MPEVVSCSDNFRLSAPHTLAPQVQTLIYVNDEVGEDVQTLFAQIDTIRIIEHPYMRESGMGVFLMSQPRSSFPDFWAGRVLALKRSLGLK